MVLLLDTRADLDADVGSWSVPRERTGGAVGPGSSLDLAVTTATALAAAHLQAGDRVVISGTDNFKGAERVLIAD